MQQPEPQTVWRGKFIEAVVDGRWEYVRRCGSHGAIGVIAVTDVRELVLVEQYRPPVQASVIEIPAGLAGDVPGQENEPLELSARRELLEETGYEALNWRRVLDGVTSAGLTNECITLFLASGLRKVCDGGGDAHEQIAVHRVPLTELERWLANSASQGKLVDIKVHLAAALAGQIAGTVSSRCIGA